MTIRAPLPRPPFGLHTRVKVVRVLDGDTVECVGELLGKRFRVRILGINAPETRTRDQEEKQKGLQAKHFLQNMLLDREGVSLLIPLPEKPEYDLLRSLLTMDRILGHLYLDDETSVADEMVKEGMARWMDKS